MEDRGVLQDVIPDVIAKLSYVPIKGWIIDPDLHSLLYGPGYTVCLPTSYGKTVHADVMIWGVTMVKDGGRALRCSLNFSKGPSWLIYVLLFTVCMDTLTDIDYPTFLGDFIHVLWGYQEVPDGVVPLRCA